MGGQINYATTLAKPTFIYTKPVTFVHLNNQVNESTLNKFRT